MRKNKKPKYYVAQMGAQAPALHNTLGYTGQGMQDMDPVTAQYYRDNNTPFPVSPANTVPLSKTATTPNTSANLPPLMPSQNAFIPVQQQRQKRSGPLQENPFVTAFNGVAQGVTSIADQLTNNQLNKREYQQQIRANQRFQQAPQGPLNTNPAYTQLGGWVGQLRAGNAPSRYQVGGQQEDDGLTYSDPEDNNDYSGDILEELKAGGWIKGAINPKHKGYCTPITKSTCTGHRKALALRFKHGDLHKSQFGGDYEEYGLDEMKSGGKWIQGAVNPAHKGYCTPMTKATCTPRRKAFAMTMKKHHGFHEAGGYVMQTGGQSNAQGVQNAANQAASQAATGNPQAPVQAASVQQQTQYPDKNTLRKKYASNPFLSQQGRYNWGSKLDTEFQNGNGGNVRDSVYAAARANKLDPALLYSSAMEEGMSGRVDSKASQNVSNDFPDELSGDYPIDGFLNYGLDQFAGQSKDLEKKGYLPKGFASNYKTYKTKNEKGDTLNAPAFNNDANALLAKGAMMRQAQDQLQDYTKKSGVNLTPEQQNFFLLANYNGGEGNMQKMIQSYQQKGYLKDNKFLDASFKPESYGSIYNNVQARLQSANELKNEGYFKDYNSQAQQNENNTNGQQSGTMKAGGTVTRKNDYGSKSHPYPSVNAKDFAGGHRSYPIPTKENGRKALFLAHIHHRPDVIAKVHAKYPGLKQLGGIGGTGAEDLMTSDNLAKTGGWIQHAINPAHKGYCTPMTKSTCTPHRKALAMRFKHGDLHKHQTGGDLYNDVPQYEIDNNMLMQMGGNIQQVQGLQPHQEDMANVEAERGEVYTDQHGNMNQVNPSGATHEQGGEMLPQVSRVLENTSNIRKDKVSKYLKLNPEQVKALTGLDTTKSMSHAEALVEGAANINKQQQNIVSKIQLTAKGRNGYGLDMYGENATKLNIDHIRAMPTKQELFNRLFDHQEMTKNALGINNDGTQAKTGGKYKPFNAYQAGGVTAYPGNTSGQTTPAGNSDAFQGSLSDYLNSLKANGFKFDNIHSNADLQRALYSHELKNNPQALRNMWQEGIHNYGAEKAIKAGLVYGQDDPNKGVKKGQFKPGVLDKPENLQKLADLYPDNLLGRRILSLSADKGPKLWTDNDLPPTPNAPDQLVNNPNPTIQNNLKLKSNPKSTFNEPLRWFDTASPLNAYVSSLRRLPENFNPVDIHQVNLKLLDPTAALRANQQDYNAAVQAVQQADPNNAGAQMANIANLSSRKYALNNQVLGNYENQNTAIKNQEITYNANAKDRQSAADQQSREVYSEKVLTSKAKQQEQKLTALDSLYKTIAENSALNRNGNLIMKMSRAFDQYGNYNGYAPSFQPNPQLGISANPATNPPPPANTKYQPAGGIQNLTPGKSYYNRRTGKTLRYDGTNLTEIK